jgi:hypothetical protein
MRIAALVIVALVLAGCGGGTRTVTVTTTVARPRAPVAPGPQNTVYFGQPVSVSTVDPHRDLLVLKPESYLVGVTANVAFSEQDGKACAPLLCPGVADDRLVVPAGTQNLTFVLPANVSGTVLTQSGSKMRTTRITAPQLAELVRGAKTPKLVEPLDSGLWLAVNVDNVTSFAQQFEP